VRIEHTQDGSADSDEDALEAKKEISESLSFMSKENAGTVLAFIVLGLALYLFWVVLTRFIGFLENANPSVASAVTGTIATLLVAFWSNLYVQRQVKLREIEEAHRPRKTEIYEEFLNVISRQLAASNPLVESAALGEDELMKYLVKLQTQLILWGSPEVIKAFQVFKTSSSSDIHSLLGVDKLLRAIRTDIGLSIQGLYSYELVKMYLKDPQEMDDALPSNKVLQRTGS
jgi:hypothetical protein